ncbi:MULTISPECIES: helix-turn-helix transcriptional regulator [unclassified Mesorhizobium]
MISARDFRSPGQREMTIRGVQCRMARAALGLKISELASLAGVAPTTITRLEAGTPIGPRTLSSIEKTLEEGGIRFVFAENGDCGIMLSPFQITFVVE